MKYARRSEAKRSLLVRAPAWPLASIRIESNATKAKRRARASRGASHAHSLKAAVRALGQTNGGAVHEADVSFILGQMSDTFPEGIALFTSDARVVYVNNAYCRLLGRRRQELLGTTSADCLGELNSMAPVCSEYGRGRKRYEMQMLLPGGASAVVQVCTQRIVTASGRDVGYFVILTDITARANAEAGLRRSESDLRLLSAQLLSAQELERQRIARELHDGIGQALGGVKCSLEACEALIERGAAQGAVDKLKQLGDRVRSIVDEVRRIAMDLRPSTLDDLGVLATLGWLSREFRGVHAGVNLETLVEVCEDEIAPLAKTALYRIVQESLNNVVTHSRARNVSIVIRRNYGHVELLLRDDGIGFEPARFSSVDKSGRGLGLASMRERAEASGGRLRLESEHGRGTCVWVAWPNHRPRQADRPQQTNDSSALHAMQPVEQGA